MSKKTLEQYYRFYSQDWVQTEQTLWRLVRSDKRVTALRNMLDKDRIYVNVDTKIASTLYLILLQENKALEAEVEQLRVLEQATKEGNNSDFSTALLKILFDRLTQWKGEIDNAPKEDLIKLVDFLDNLSDDIANSRQSLSDLLKRMEKKHETRQTSSGDQFENGNGRK